MIGIGWYFDNVQRVNDACDEDCSHTKDLKVNQAYRQ